MEPFWKLGDVPIKPVTLPSLEDIENEMKIIESEMTALLKPEEKYLKRSIAFTIAKAESGRSNTPGCVPQRLLKHHKSKVRLEYQNIILWKTPRSLLSQSFRSVSSDLHQC